MGSGSLTPSHLPGDLSGFSDPNSCWGRSQGSGGPRRRQWVPGAAPAHKPLQNRRFLWGPIPEPESSLRLPHSPTWVGTSQVASPPPSGTRPPSLVYEAPQGHTRSQSCVRSWGARNRKRPHTQHGKGNSRRFAVTNSRPAGWAQRVSRLLLQTLVSASRGWGDSTPLGPPVGLPHSSTLHCLPVNRLGTHEQPGFSTQGPSPLLSP